MHTDDTGRTSLGTRNNASCKRSVFRMRTRVSTRRWAHRNWFPALSQRASPPPPCPARSHSPRRASEQWREEFDSHSPGHRQTDERWPPPPPSQLLTAPGDALPRSTTIRTYLLQLRTALGAHWDNRYHGTPWTDHLEVCTDPFSQNSFVGE